MHPPLTLTNVMASSLDGHIASFAEESDAHRKKMGFISEGDKAHVESLMASADAVLISGRTMRAAGGIWQISGRQPHWFVVSNAGIDEVHPFWTSRQVTRTLVSSNDQLLPIAQGYGVHLAIIDPAKDLAQECVRILLDSGVKSCLLFGGGELNRHFYNAGLVDELYLTICPWLIGNLKAPKVVAPPLTHPHSFKLLSLNSIDNHVILRYRHLHSV